MKLSEANTAIGKRVVAQPIVDIRSRGVGVLLQGWELFEQYKDWRIVEVDEATQYVKVQAKDCEYFMWLNPEHLMLID